MMKKIFIIGLFLAIGFSARSQMYSYGLKAGLNYSSYNLSNQYVFYQTEGSGIGFHGGLFGRRNLGKFFIQTELNFTTGLNGKIMFRRQESSFSKSSISLPMIIGRNFYPGNIRIYTGLVPAFYFGKDNIHEFLKDRRLIAQGTYKSSPGIAYLAGCGIDLLKFMIDIRYEGNLLGGFYLEKRNPDITTFHRFSLISLSLGYKLQ